MSSKLTESSTCNPRLALATSGVFLAIIFSLPAIQLASEIYSQPREWPAVLRLLPAVPRVLAAGGNPKDSTYQRIMAANQQLCEEFRNYESHVTESAWPIGRPRAWLQAGLTGPLRSGNEQVVVGSGGWLFFRPDVEALTGPGFLEPHRIRPGIATTFRTTNPLPAIRQFAADLHARGIKLIIVPIPSKGALLGANHRRTQDNMPLHNASFGQFVSELSQSQIELCDPTVVLMDRPGSEQYQSKYLKTDSHWTPEGVRLTAELVAQKVHPMVQSGARQPTLYETKKVSWENVGDTARLLGGNTTTQVIAPESCAITQVRNLDHSEWSPDPPAEIVLLGDSFTNIYSQSELGWGTSAGFAEHLSLALRQPIDRIALNAGGALAARRELLRQLQQPGPDRLAGKKLVIWQFAERELTFGDWQILPLPRPFKSSPVQQPQTAEVIAEGLIVQAGHLPNPASLPYREALIPLHLQSVRSVGIQKIPAEIVVYVWGMQDRKLTTMAGWKAGQQVRLKLTPWSTAERRFGRFARAELEDPDFRLIDLPTYWGQP
ncbi:MAG: hypothetical protein JWN70_5640 [Planctomycetaceae bacterium]|nr:hypothetical protein [Planctomycetaceae bacterium]